METEGPSLTGPLLQVVLLVREDGHPEDGDPVVESLLETVEAPVGDEEARLWVGCQCKIESQVVNTD